VLLRPVPRPSTCSSVGARRRRFDAATDHLEPDVIGRSGEFAQAFAARLDTCSRKAKLNVSYERWQLAPPARSALRVGRPTSIRRAALGQCSGMTLTSRARRTAGKVKARVGAACVPTPVLGLRAPQQHRGPAPLRSSFRGQTRWRTGHRLRTSTPPARSVRSTVNVVSQRNR
jgi:hypothetical protein